MSESELSLTAADALREAGRRLRDADVTRSPRLDAELLLAKVLGVTRAELFREPGRVLAADEAAEFEALLSRRLVPRTGGLHPR